MPQIFKIGPYILYFWSDLLDNDDKRELPC